MRLSRGINTEFLRKNKKAQYVLFTLYSILLFSFFLLYNFQLSSLLSSIKTNDSVLEQDVNASKVISYEVKDKNRITGILSDNSTFDIPIDNVVFVSKLPDADFSLLSDSQLICVPTASFATDMLIGSKAFIMLALSLFMIIVLKLAKKKGYEGLSNRKVHIINWILCACMLSLVGTTYILMSK